jgi:hypothetical protein
LKHSPAGHAGGGAFFPIEQRGNKEKSRHIGHPKKGNKREKMLIFVEVCGAKMLTFANLSGLKR